MRKIVILFGLLALSFALPVTKNEKKEEEKDKPKTDESHASKYDEGYDKDDPRNRPDLQLEYSKYLQEVVSALENDPEFRAKLDKADEADIRSGKIAEELEYVSHNVRSRLDELKRQELERLRRLAIKQFEVTNEIDRDHLKIAEHLDHENPHTFESKDLQKLIHKTSNELAEADKLRRDEFKRYEMQKEFEQHQKMETMDEQHKKEYEQELQKEKEKHNKHDPIHAPGHKAQLEEVWEKQDHMDSQDFDPKTFFLMHDLDGNGVWDELEVKALFARELDKVYQSGMPEDDMRERAEEMERMREHVFKEADSNKDHLISFEEFMDQTKRAEFQQDEKWETVDNVPQYTHEEYLQYERKRQEEIQRLINEGLLPPHPNMPGAYHPGQMQYQGHPNEIPHYQQQQGGYHPQQQGYPNQQHHDAARAADNHHQQQQLHYQQQQAQQQHHQQQQQQQVYQQQYHPQAPPQQQQQPNVQYQQQPVGQAPPQYQQVPVQQQQQVPVPQQPPVAQQQVPVQQPPPPQQPVPVPQQQQQPSHQQAVNAPPPQAPAAPVAQQANVNAPPPPAAAPQQQQQQFQQPNAGQH